MDRDELGKQIDWSVGWAGGRLKTGQRDLDSDFGESGMADLS